MLSLFRTNQSYVSLLLFGYALALQLPWLIYGKLATAPPEATYFGRAIYRTVYATQWLPWLLPVVLTGLLGLLANLLSDRFRQARTPTQFPGLFVVLIWGLSPAFHSFHLIQIVHLLLVFALLAVGRLYKSNSPEVPLFNIGMWLGVATLIYPQYLLLLPALLAAISTLSTLSLRRILQLLVGPAVIYFILGSYLYAIGDFGEFWRGQLDAWHLGEFVGGNYYAGLATLLLVFPLLTVLLASERIRSLLNMEGSKNVSVLYWLLLFSAGPALLVATITYTNAQTVVLPLGMLFGLWFVRLAPTRAAFFHLLLLTAAIGGGILSLWV